MLVEVTNLNFGRNSVVRSELIKILKFKYFGNADVWLRF